MAMSTIRVMALALVSGAAVASTQGQKPSLHVCVGDDRVLRHQPTGPCPSGTTGYELALEADELGLPPGEDGKASEQRVEELRLKLDLLSSKLMEVQKELATAAAVRAGGKVVAPFEVVDQTGKMIFRVRQDPRGFEMATASGASVAWGSALEAGGVFKTRSSASFPEVVMGSAGAFGGFAIRDAEQRGRTSLSLTNGKPSLEMNNENYVGIVAITQGASGGGLVQLGNATGNAMVQAGTTSGNCGKVETFPTRPPAAVVGLAGSWIIGKGC
jgi:hypothetical protein